MKRHGWSLTAKVWCTCGNGKRLQILKVGFGTSKGSARHLLNCTLYIHLSSIPSRSHHCNASSLLSLQSIGPFNLAVKA